MTGYVSLGLRGPGKGCEMMGLISDRKDVIDPNGDKRTAVVKCQCLEIVEQAPGDGG